MNTVNMIKPEENYITRTIIHVHGTLTYFIALKFLCSSSLISNTSSRIFSITCKKIILGYNFEKLKGDNVENTDDLQVLYARSLV